MASKIPADYKHNGLNYQQWQAEGRAWYVKNGKMDGWPNRFWIRPDGEQIELYSTKRGSGPKKTPDDVLAIGGHMKPRKTSIRTNFVSNRKDLEEVPERLRERFDSDEAFEEYKKYVKRGNTANQKLSSQASQSGTKFNKGHVVAVGAGGSHDPMAQRLESETGNKSSQNVGEIPPDRLAATGTPRNWDEAVTMYQNPDYVPTELTPQDKQRIWQGEDPDIVYGQRQTQIDANPLARPNTNRVATLQPGLQVSGGNVRIRPAQVVRAARGVSPMWASLPLGVTALGMSGQSALANPSAETIEDVGWDAANLVADAASLIPIPPVIAAAEGTQKLLGVAHQARLGQRALADQEGLPGPLEKIAKDPLNELEYAGKQVMNFFGDALRMGSEAGY